MTDELEEAKAQWAASERLLLVMGRENEVLRAEVVRLTTMLAAAVQSLDTACAVRDLTEAARRSLLDSRQAANDAQHETLPGQGAS